jgi:phenylalanine-4-hydroxylase
MFENHTEDLPEHLKKYIVEQNYSRYTPQDQAVWRYCLRQLKKFLSIHGHHSYLSGLEKTGIDIETIPKISDISEKIQKFGWRALPVSGFIPPAAFMELQSLSVLPIASDMRTIDHLLYTPAPDIVHEAAGHAPILVDPEYADYLRQYSQIAKKAIISKEDLDLYEAIRELSDLKENPNSTPDEIQKCENNLNEISKSMTHVSEASQLSRMNWWTAEYGLIGDIKTPKIFGAGLLSSVGESKWCLSEKVKKIPLTIDCIQQSYDITEPQPQLFVTPDFKNLVNVLNQFSEMMAYKMGGKQGLDKAIQAKSVNTVQLDSGFQISGVCSDYILDSDNNIIFIKFMGPTQICLNEKEILGQDKYYHAHGYSAPMGHFSVSSENVGDTVTVKYNSGFEIHGLLKNIFIQKNGAKIYRYSNATATYQNQIYFQPDWGDFDVVTGSTVTSVFGGPADRIKYGETTDFVAKRVPESIYTVEQRKLFQAFQNTRDLRTKTDVTEKNVIEIFKLYQNLFSKEWLLFIELLELSIKNNLSENLINEIKMYLFKLKDQNSHLSSVIDDGIAFAHE